MRAEKPDQDAPNPQRRAVIVAGGALVLGMMFRPLRAAAQGKQRVGVIGSGHIGGTIGGLWVKAGHPVFFSSRQRSSGQQCDAGEPRRQVTRSVPPRCRRQHHEALPLTGSRRARTRSAGRRDPCMPFTPVRR